MAHQGAPSGGRRGETLLAVSGTLRQMTSALPMPPSGIEPGPRYSRSTVTGPHDMQETIETLKPRVRLLLDVDGVLNALSDSDSPGMWTDWRFDMVNGFAITWSPTVARFIRTLSGQGVDVQWLTTWGHKANDFLCAVLDLPQFPVVGEYGYDSGPSWWKLGPAQALYQLDPVPFVWIDDDLGYDFEAVEWLATLPADSHLAVTPDSFTGLDSAHVDRISAFVSRWLTG
jgi:hypothetical protein